jgi:NhaP-type Na+/H+ and K+/H+ antiporter
MNKSILLQSIKSVSGFLAVLLFVLYGVLLGLQNYPTIAVPALIVAIFAWMVWMEYKARS